MKMIVLYCSILAVIIFIPLLSIQHFIPPLKMCMLADLCNHTWIPECATDAKNNVKLFTDECDLVEYNCDHDTSYTKIEYAECLKPTPCPTLPPAVRSRRRGDYLYDEKPPPVPFIPQARRRYTPQSGRMLKYLTTPCAPCWRGIYSPTPKPKRKPKLKPRRRMLQSITSTTTKKDTQTPAISTVLLKTEIVYMHGMKLYKVIKGFPQGFPPTVKTDVQDSDFMEK